MITVNTQKPCKNIKNFWNNIHFHPTDAIEDDWGQRILNRVIAEKAADMVRMYAMLEDIVTMDENGTLQYDFTLNDTRMDYMVSKGFKLLVCYCFIPPCIAEDFTPPEERTRYKGKYICPTKPKDFALWEEVCYEYTKHIVERYGVGRVSEWRFHCYNEPDHFPYLMTTLGKDEQAVKARTEVYCQMYKGFVHAFERVCPALKIGGPTATGGNPEFKEAFFRYVKENNLKLDFVSMHSYGVAVSHLIDGRSFNAYNHLRSIDRYEEIVQRYFPEGKEFIIDEWGAAGSGFRNYEKCRKLLFREDSDYACYFGQLITRLIDAEKRIERMMICLSGSHQMTKDFTGYRNFFTLNFIGKPIYNAYVMVQQLKDTTLAGKADNEHITLLPTADAQGNLAVMLAYSDDEYIENLPDFCDTLQIDGMHGKKKITLYKIDRKTTNPYQYALQHGWGEVFNEQQIAVLQEEGTLKPYREWTADCTGMLCIEVDFTDRALFLAKIENED